MKLVGYLRVSTELQAKYGGGMETQRTSIEEWAAANGHKVIAWFCDEAESGKDGLDTRVGLARALSLLEEPGGAARGLVVDYLDRLSRLLVLQETIVMRLRAVKVEVVSVKEPAVLGDEALRDLMRQVLGAFAQYDRAKLRGRMIAGANRKAVGGGYAYGRPPYGWRADGEGSLVPVAEEQRVVADIQRLRQGGMTLREIAELLNLSGLTRPGGGVWRSEQVRRVLHAKVPPVALAAARLAGAEGSA